MVKGKRYRVTTRTQAGNYRWVTHVMVAQYLGTAHTGEDVFNLRPLAGTTTVDPDSIVSVELTDAPISCPRRVTTPTPMKSGRE
jgi:hypothetical protein